MCGIVGLLERRGQAADGALLQRMADTLAHRGPDGEGQHLDGPVGLHHKRLAIIDPEGGAQPMVRGARVLIFNGAIYNYLELRETLEARGCALQTRSDTEVILGVYETFGLEGFEQLRGMYAFVLYDGQRGELIAARDHFGIKPLYLLRSPERLIFASEIKAILAHPDVSRRRDDVALDHYLTFQYVLGERTLFEGIEQVPAGTALRYDRGGELVERRTLWAPSFEIDASRGEADFAEALAELLAETVRLQTRADVPVGAHLSGGMDSSLVALLAGPHVGETLRTFTGAFDDDPAGGERYDESGWAAMVAEHGGFHNEVVRPEPARFAELLPRLLWHMDEPAAGPGLFPQYCVSALAAEQVKVVLGGQGGDEMFGGYARYLVAYLEQALKGAITETNDEGEHIVSLASILPNLPWLERYAPMLQGFWQRGLFGPMDERYFALIDRSAGNLALLSPERRAAYDRGALFEAFRRAFERSDTRSYYNKMTSFDMASALPALLQVEDRVSMAVGLESRVPLLDHRVVDLVASAPPAVKFRGGAPKHLLRRAATRWLPAPILERRDKMGFPVPLQRWARGPLRDFVGDVLLGESCRQRGLFDPAELTALIEGEAPFGRQLWGALSLELWHQIYFDGRGERP